MGKLESAVVLTKKYAAYFHSPLDLTGLHRWLISDKIFSQKSISRFFIKLSRKQMGERDKRQKISPKKLIKAKEIVRFLSFFPTISLILVTGSLAISNAKARDDIDLMVVTQSNTLWLTRLLVIPLLSLFFPRRHPQTKTFLPDAVCLNLWLDESSLAIPMNKRNLYTAHEVLQALPLFDRGGVYHRFVEANSWTKKYLANAFQVAKEVGGEVMQNRAQKNFVPRILNRLAFKLQYLYMKRRITGETISLHSAYFHPRDLSQKLNRHLGIY